MTGDRDVWVCRTSAVQHTIAENKKHDTPVMQQVNKVALKTHVYKFQVSWKGNLEQLTTYACVFCSPAVVQLQFQVNALMQCNGLEPICSLIYSVNEEQQNKQSFSPNREGETESEEFKKNKNKTSIDIYFPLFCFSLFSSFTKRKQRRNPRPPMTNFQWETELKPGLVTTPD